MNELNATELTLKHGGGAKVHVVINCMVQQVQVRIGLTVISKNESWSRLLPSTLEADYGCLGPTPRPNQQQGTRVIVTLYLDDEKNRRGGVKCSVVHGDDGRAVFAKQVPDLENTGPARVTHSPVKHFPCTQQASGPYTQSPLHPRSCHSGWGPPHQRPPKQQGLHLPCPPQGPARCPQPGRDGVRRTCPGRMV